MLDTQNSAARVAATGSQPRDQRQSLGTASPGCSPRGHVQRRRALPHSCKSPPRASVQTGDPYTPQAAGDPSIRAKVWPHQRSAGVGRSVPPPSAPRKAPQLRRDFVPQRGTEIGRGPSSQAHRAPRQEPGPIPGGTSLYTRDPLHPASLPAWHGACREAEGGPSAAALPSQWPGQLLDTTAQPSRQAACEAHRGGQRRNPRPRQGCQACPSSPWSASNSQALRRRAVSVQPNSFCPSNRAPTTRDTRRAAQRPPARTWSWSSPRHTAGDRTRRPASPERRSRLESSALPSRLNAAGVPAIVSVHGREPDCFGAESDQVPAPPPGVGLGQCGTGC
mmetsp:Transcript_25712/g.67466  ORF Transcript_25712/g.67466 Transcript_25712/m.67466 type:complete len:335 (+) Transcript_25712:1161-2165(+)